MESVFTGQRSYQPGSLVDIHGTGYSPGCDVVVKVTRPDGTVVTGDGTFTPGSDTVTTDLFGNFSYDYQLQSVPAIEGTYEIDVLGAADAVLAHAWFVDAFGITKLYVGSIGAGNEDYVFTAGDTIVADTDVDPADSGHPNRTYRYFIVDASSSVRFASTCTANPAGGGSPALTYTVQASDPVSNATDYTFKLRQYLTATDCNNDPNGTGTREKEATKAFDVAKATSYSDATLATTKNAFKAGDSAFVTVAGLNQNISDWANTWIATGLNCANTGGGDRPDSTTAGAMPDVAGTSLQYPPRPAPDTGTDQWNWLSKYESSTCPAFSNTNQGTWQLKLQKDNTHFVTLNVFSVDTTKPDVTIDQGGTQSDATTVSPIHFTATFSEPVTGFTGSDVSFAGSTAGGTLAATVAEIAPNDGTTYDVSVTGMTTRGTVIATIPAGGASDAAGNTNNNSTSGDNSVTWDRVPTTGVTLNDNSPKTNDLLIATATPSDPDGDTVTLTYVWKVNGTTKQTTTTTSTTDSFNLATAGNGDKGDTVTVTVTVTPNDGLFDGSPATDSATISNSAPSATVALSDASPRTNDTLTATATRSDADGDSVSLDYVWKVNGTVVRDVTKSSGTAADLTDSLDLSQSGNGDKGDTVEVFVTPNDGSTDGATVDDAATVANTAPVVDTASIDQSSAQTNDTLTASYTAHDADGDSLTPSYQWYKNGSPLAGETGSSLDLSQSGNGDKGDEITVRVSVSDGTASDALTSAGLTISNSAPVVDSLAGATPVDEGQTESYTFTAHDDDGDTLSFSTGYPKCGTGGELQGSPAVGDGSFDCKFTDGPADPTVAVKVTDGTDASNEATKSVHVNNLPPSTPSLVAPDDNATTNDHTPTRLERLDRSSRGKRHDQLQAAGRRQRLHLPEPRNRSEWLELVGVHPEQRSGRRHLLLACDGERRRWREQRLQLGA